MQLREAEAWSLAELGLRLEVVLVVGAVGTVICWTISTADGNKDVLTGL